jgi:tetratricopeptide (TPR) repeat protein
MQTQAYFDDIQFQILHELRKASSSIHIAVAWFTDPDIFEQLCQKASSGVRVELIVINDSFNRKKSFHYERLRNSGGTFIMVGDNKKNCAKMHNKFCVIDGATVITGSYNWSRNAQRNNENITVTSGHPELAQQFIEEFESLVDRHSAREAVRAPKAEKTTSAEWFKNISELVVKKDWPGLLNHALRWTQTLPGDAVAWNSLGYAYGESNQPAKEIEAFQQAIRINPEYAVAWYNLGNVYINADQHAKAIEAYQQAIHIDPEYADAWHNLGVAYRKSNQPAKEIEAYQQAVRINPELDVAWNNLGYAYSKSNQPTKAIEAYQQVVRIKPEYADVWYFLGVAYSTSNQSGQVMEVYKRLKALDPAKADKFYNTVVIAKEDDFNRQRSKADGIYKEPTQSPPEKKESTTQISTSGQNISRPTPPTHPQQESPEQDWQPAPLPDKSGSMAWLFLLLVFIAPILLLSFVLNLGSKDNKTTYYPPQQINGASTVSSQVSVTKQEPVEQSQTYEPNFSSNRNTQQQEPHRTIEDKLPVGTDGNTTNYPQQKDIGTSVKATPPLLRIPVNTTKPIPKQSDPIVITIQNKLNRLGYDAGLADGFAGRKTTVAIEAFQRDHNIIGDGVINALLLDQINQVEKSDHPISRKLTVLNPSGGTQADAEERKVNLDACLDGHFPMSCKRELLTSKEVALADAAEKKVNFETCLDGFSLACKRGLLTSKELIQVDAAEQRVKLQR